MVRPLFFAKNQRNKARDDDFMCFQMFLGGGKVVLADFSCNIALNGQKRSILGPNIDPYKNCQKTYEILIFRSKLELSEVKNTLHPPKNI